ncbi:guanylate kinase [Geitlerinema sp. P-1104]|uniref:guanylate kinase n=1 Tax=Geitlerinema sp. P-1104 TaxID=2546230 RepID=UPI0014777503|nr:guanylate kinase [Geitlerinema sp. P-1104]NMG58379.1 guanylate kinase [Geitlerinema sp. P-1104]
MTAGKLIVLTGPSGVGKGTLLRSLRQRHPELCLSISATTRQPRPGEVDGVDYHFLSRQQFQDKIAQDAFLEWAEFAGNCYGTPRQSLETQMAQGHWVILEIEVEGARQVRRSFPDALLVFVHPPSFAELERRLRGRDRDSEEAIRRRLERAKEELQAADEFDVQVTNGVIEEALQALEVAVFGERKA